MLNKFMLCYVMLYICILNNYEYEKIFMATLWVTFPQGAMGRSKNCECQWHCFWFSLLCFDIKTSLLDAFEFIA